MLENWLENRLEKRLEPRFEVGLEWPQDWPDTVIESTFGPSVLGLNELLAKFNLETLRFYCLWCENSIFTKCSEIFEFRALN